MEQVSKTGDNLTRIAHELRCSYSHGPEWGARQQLMPDPRGVMDLFMDIRAILFPGYFESANLGACGDTSCLMERIGLIYWRLAKQIHNTLASSCPPECGPGCDVMVTSCGKAEEFLAMLPAIRAALLLDVEAAYLGDPAARGYEEILMSYPGVLAITAHRLDHVLHGQGLVLMARILSEYAHSATGIDIHPGASIGKSFFIDHGTGVVIGETSVIGDRVKLYQGVTLGALSFLKDGDGNLIRNSKRHPTIEDDVTVYAGATILGGETIVGCGSVIGGNVWLTESVPPMSKVLNKPSIELHQRRTRKAN